MTAQDFYTQMWERLRAATTIPVGDAVLAEWHNALTDGTVIATSIGSARGLSNIGVIAALRNLLRPTIERQGDVHSGAELLIELRPMGRWVALANVASERAKAMEYAYRKSLQAEYAEASAYWAGRVASFAAAASAELASVTAVMADTLAGLSDDVDRLAYVLQTIGYGDVPPEVREWVDTSLRAIRENRSRDSVEMRAAAARLRVIEQSVVAGDLEAFEEVEVSSAVPPLAKVALAAGAAFLLSKGVS